MGPKKCDSIEESVLRVERCSLLMHLESQAVRTGEEPEEHERSLIIQTDLVDLSQ